MKCRHFETVIVLHVDAASYDEAFQTNLQVAAFLESLPGKKFTARSFDNFETDNEGQRVFYLDQVPR